MDSPTYAYTDGLSVELFVGQSDGQSDFCFHGRQGLQKTSPVASLTLISTADVSRIPFVSIRHFQDFHT